MKKNALVQLIVIYVGIMAIYADISNLELGVTYLFTSSFQKYSNDFNIFLAAEYLVIFIVILLTGFIVISKSGNIAKFITEKSGLEDSLTIFSTPKQLLSILIVVLALGHLLDHIPTFLKDVYLSFTSHVPHRIGNEFENPPPSWIIDLFHLLLPCLMIIFCRNLTEYFSKNIILDEEEMVAVHDTVDIESIGEEGEEE